MTQYDGDDQISTHLRKKGRPFDINKMYVDLGKCIQKLHPTIDVPEDMRELTGYNPINGSIIDDYKSVLHLKILRRNKDLGVVSNGSDIILDIFDKYGLGRNVILAEQTNVEINKIMEKWLGPEVKKNAFNR
ncbi:hypothetical protein BDD43_4428 [Mucilaginibacter gracilis]|uniref:Uncharacterized protein n=1 Tax=Mucilaginibacter gracilis TaxID=423350 RepID=A0A495J653_9SPHI|nr:hypothetical protein [Mucilaginibacter gracilis]RKR84201.1 hypothetical protein BDD43_4428 [Mucilaginibacter gracilis]